MGNPQVVARPGQTHADDAKVPRQIVGQRFQGRLLRPDSVQEDEQREDQPTSLPTIQHTSLQTPDRLFEHDPTVGTVPSGSQSAGGMTGNSARLYYTQQKRGIRSHLSTSF